MDGYEVCGHLKANPNAEHPAIFLTQEWSSPAGPIFLVFIQLELALGPKKTLAYSRTSSAPGASASSW